MKNFSIILVLLILCVASCKDKPEDTPPCEVPYCPLENGEYCPNNMINVDNECTCKDGWTQVGDRCMDLNDPFFDGFALIIFDTINCGCVQNKMIQFNLVIDSNYFNGFYLTRGTDHPMYFDSNIDGPPTPANFYANIYPYGRCNPEDTGFATKPLYMHGSINGDTLYYDLFFYNSTDTCAGFKQGDLRL